MVFSSVCILNVVLTTTFGIRCCYIETIQSVFVVTRLWFDVNYSTCFHIMLSLIVFLFLRIISEDAGERDLVCLGLTMEIPELCH